MFAARQGGGSFQRSSESHFATGECAPIQNQSHVFSILTQRRSYHRIDPDLVLPTVRAQIERDCTAIAEGKQAFADVVQRSLAVFRAKFANFVSSIALMDELFEASFTQMQSSQSRPLSRCGRCRRYMQFVSIKPQRMYCPTCEDAWSMPQGVLVKGGDASARCPLCDYELVICQTQTRVPKSFTLCPHCYNNPPFEELKGHAMTCGSFMPSYQVPSASSSFHSQANAPLRAANFPWQTLASVPVPNATVRASLSSMVALVALASGALSATAAPQSSLFNPSARFKGCRLSRQLSGVVAKIAAAIS